jgi:hypothetical protein
METANNLYAYDQTFLSCPKYKLYELIDICHRASSNALNWTYSPLVPGQFGYDNMAISIGHVLSNYKQAMNLDEVASLVHDGWSINYRYWRDFNPFETNSFYKKPYNPLGDERRDNCANTKFPDLNVEEQQKDRIIAQALLSL